MTVEAFKQMFGDSEFILTEIEFRALQEVLQQYPEIIKFGIKAKNIVFISDIIEILIRVKDFLEMEGYLPDDKTNLCIKNQLEILRKYHKPKVPISEYSFSFKK